MADPAPRPKDPWDGLPSWGWFTLAGLSIGSGLVRIPPPSLLPLSISLATAFFVWGVLRWGVPPRAAFHLQYLAAAAFLLAPIAFVYSVLDRFEEPAIRAAVDFLNSHPGSANTALATAALCVVGYLLFQLKMRRLRWYARAEIAFALLSCYLAVERIKSEGFSTATVAAVVGAVYLLVRGLENQRKDLESRRTQAMPFSLPPQQTASATASEFPTS